MSLLLQILVSTLANIIFWVGLGGLVWLLALRSRRLLDRLFGLGADGRLTMYLSNAAPREQSNDDRRLLVSAHEMRTIWTFGALLGRGSARSPDLVRGLVDSLFLRTPVQLSVEVSPQEISIATAGPLILIGAGPRNVVRQSVVDQGYATLVTSIESPAAVELQGGRYVRITRGDRTGERIGLRQNFAIVERVVEMATRRNVVCCLGMRADSSWLATEWLSRHWRIISKHAKSDAFAFCLSFPTSGSNDNYLSEYVEPQILFSTLSVLPGLPRALAGRDVEGLSDQVDG
jgi:hypothetical protein